MLRSIDAFIPHVLLSATISVDDRLQVLAAHGIRHATVYAIGTARHNLSLRVVTVEQKRFASAEDAIVAELLRDMSTKWRAMVQKGTRRARFITFCLTVDMAIQLSRMLNEESFISRTLLYHGRMDDDERVRNHEEWNMAGDMPGLTVMSCTSAFGTGVDTKDIREIYHFGGSWGLGQYAQEVGRAGRDGRPATCTVIYSPKLVRKFGEVFLSTSTLEDDLTKHWKLGMFQEFCAWAEEKQRCRKNSLYGRLDAKPPGLCIFNENSVNCDTCGALVGQDCKSKTARENMVLGSQVSDMTGYSVFAERSENKEASLVCATLNPSKTKRGQSPLPFKKLPCSNAGLQSAPLENDERNECVTPGFVHQKGIDSMCIPQTQEIKDRRDRYSQPVSANRKDFSQGLSITNHAKTVITGLTPLTRQAVNSQVALEGENFETHFPWIRWNAREIVSKYREFGFSVQHSCIPCLVIEGQEKTAHRCPHMSNRCLRCFSLNHYTSNCCVNHFRKGYCKRCNVGNVDGVTPHTDGFQNSCPMEPCRNICWMMWQVKEYRDVIITKFFNVVQKEAYEAAGTSIWKQMDVFQKMWLHNRGRVSNVINLVLWFAKNTGLVSEV